MTTRLFTCLACSVGFHTPNLQRDHYRTDWHRYNLKRKVADMPPVTAETFAEKVIITQNQSNADVEKANFITECGICEKTYYSLNAYSNHLLSKRHRTLARDNPESDIPSVPSTKPVKVPILEMDEISKPRRLSPEECLFCTHKAENSNANLLHMKKVHGLFIPEQDFLVNITGLLEYLAEKVSIGNMCLYCQKSYRTLEGVQNHMLDKEHCKIAYEDEDSQLEIGEFYDFTASYKLSDAKNDVTTDDGESWESVSDNSSLESSDIGRLQSDPYSLSLPSGRIIGHRSLRTYYRQHISRHPDGMNTNRTITNGRPSARDLSFAGVSMSRRKWAEKHIKSFVDQRRREDFKTMMAFKNNHQYLLSRNCADVKETL